MQTPLLLGLLITTAHCALLPGGHHGHGDHGFHDHDPHGHDHGDDHIHPQATGEEAREALTKLNNLFRTIQVGEQLPRDMPSMNEVPSDIRFSCEGRLPGYYADVDYECQAYHVCREDHELATFLCPNATTFRQEIFACDWWFSHDCFQAPNYYHLNADLYKEEEEETEEVPQRLAKSLSSGPSFLAALQDFVSPPEVRAEGSENLVAFAKVPTQQQFFIPEPFSSGLNQKKLKQDYVPPPTGDYLPPPTNDYLPPPKNDYLPPPKNDYLPPPKDGYLPPIKKDYLPPQKKI